ncbi:Ribosomal RNA large subunit methyltransferase H [Desulfurobacterium thermolithotrophum DSM 11699]|uniref:Ribosomal RNA large subunit methyltransferase H n=1 Tax=Desulfurobacterium thermolithotrophum (strain DSM 11699 / BSA) TaxID=868864 RepID=F0S0T7_DESTD|nr:23S rRNA (pseudouridine(1915)-N(3))-methyltransferase RlmH [Desulfurobacterium thermolithotrophum]ADY72741.1 Ribosomal RNA large subunit methyltransferase H [Desulfurobacterium thermolithotrophum DSM 11699]
MKIRIVAVGKISTILKEAQEHYLQKLRILEIVEVKKQRTKEDEGKKLLEKAKGYIVALDERGREMTSKEFASFLQKHPFITFIIGGADGLSEEVREKSNFLLSLSKFTLQHDIARIVLLEQIYRADQIIKGTPYHRD